MSMISLPWFKKVLTDNTLRIANSNVFGKTLQHTTYSCGSREKIFLSAELDEAAFQKFTDAVNAGTIGNDELRQYCRKAWDDYRQGKQPLPDKALLAYVIVLSKPFDDDAVVNVSVLLDMEIPENRPDGTRKQCKQRTSFFLSEKEFFPNTNIMDNEKICKEIFEICDNFSTLQEENSMRM